MQTFCGASGADGTLTILNNGRYGCSFDGRRLTLSAIRCSTYPDPISDRGEYEFEYGLLLTGPSTSPRDQAAEGFGFNVRPWLTQIDWPGAGRRLPDECSVLSAIGGDALAAAMKPAQKGAGHVVRLFNPGEQTTSTTITARGKALTRTTILEKPRGRRSAGRLKVDLKPAGIASVMISKSPTGRRAGGRKK